MAKKFLTALNLLTVKTDPEVASVGDVYFNDGINAVKYFALADDFDAGNSSTTTFPEKLDGGSASTTTFGDIVDGSSSDQTGEWKTVPRKINELEDISFNDVSDGQVLAYDSSENKWTNVEPETTNTVPTGQLYPTTDLANGQLFFNTLTNRLSIYSGGMWIDLANYSDITQIDGGTSATIDFSVTIDGGDSSTINFERIYDGGNVNGDPVLYGFIDCGLSSTTIFATTYTGGNASTVEFEEDIDAGNVYA